jgi:hypothetical protein
MKKTLSLLVAALLVVALPLAVLAETYTSPAYGISFEIPEGMQVIEQADPTSGLTQVIVASPDGLAYAFAYGPLAYLSGVDLNAITPEKMSEVLAGMGGSEGMSLQGEVVSDDSGTYLIVTNEGGNIYTLVQLLDENGTVVITTLMSLQAPYTQEQYEAFDAFTQSIVWPEDAE